MPGLLPAFFFQNSVKLCDFSAALCVISSNHYTEEEREVTEAHSEKKKKLL